MISIKKLMIFLISAFFICSCQPSKNTANTIENTSKENSDQNTSITSYEQWFRNPVPLLSAHRGGPYPGFPENAIETFQNIANKTSVIIECDIVMTRDSILVLMHDKSLERTTTGNGIVSDLNYNEIKDLLLIDNEGNETDFRIPTLDETLKWGKGKVLFTLDVKRGVPFEKVVAAIEKNNAISFTAIITYNISDAKRVHSLNSNLIISVSARDSGALDQIKKSEIPPQKLLGFVGTREPDPEHYKKLEEMQIKTILGTLGNLDKSAVAKGDDSVYLNYIKNGAHIIATDRPLEVAEVIGKL